MAGIANPVDQDRKPITLVERVEGKLKFHSENLRKILNPDDLKDIPVAFVSIAGDLRKGKSFFLNLILKFLENEGWKNSKWLDDWDSSKDFGLKWKGGFEAHTRGIIAWGKPILINGDDDKTKIAVVLLDTEGNFGHGQSMEENVKIFALSTLFSSLQIFNLEKQIQTNDMDYLQSFVAFAKTNHPEVDRGDLEEDRKKPFQDLMFLVRDWANPKNLGYGTDGGQKYLDYIINKRNDSTQQKEISEYLKETFQHLKCFLMPEPGPDVRQDDEDRNLTKNDVGNDFFTYLEKFGNTHLHPHKISTKTSGLPRNATAEELIEDMEIFAKILDKPLDIPNIMKLIANNSKQRALKNAVETFTTDLNKGVNGMEEQPREESDDRMIKRSWDEFDKLVKDGKKEARNQLQKNTPFGMDHDDETIKKFEEQILGAEEKSKSRFVKSVIKPVAMKKAKSTFTSHLNEGIKQMEERMKVKMDEDMEELSKDKFDNLAKDGEATAWHQFLGDTRYGKDQQEAKEQFDRWIPGARKTAESQLRNMRTKYSKLVTIKNAVGTFTTHLHEGVNEMTKRMNENMDQQMIELSWDKFETLVKDGKRNAEEQLPDNPPFGREHVDEMTMEIDEQQLGVEKEAKSQFKDLRVKYLKQILPKWLEESKKEMQKNRGYYFTIPKELEKLKDDAIVQLGRIKKHTEDRDDFYKALKGAKKELEEWTSKARKGERGKNVKRAAAAGIPLMIGAAAATGGLIILPMLAVEVAVLGTLAAASVGGGAAAGAGIFIRLCEKYSKNTD